MRTLGLIGGTSWVSTIDYYRNINAAIGEKLGGLNSAKLYMYSLNLQELTNLGFNGDWDGVAKMISEASLKLEFAGAECIIICANTPHKVADEVRRRIHIPLIHIAEVTADEVVKKGIKKVALLGTKYTMEDTFFTDKLVDRGIEAIVPDEAERKFIHESIINELGQNIFTPETKGRYLSIIKQLIERGAKGLILGCTEIPLLIKQEDSQVPIFDTVIIHSQAAIEFALRES